MKNTKRGLSIFLVLALFITSIGIGFGTGSLKSAVPEAETVSKTTVDNYAIHFYVPETIYLTPSSGNASTFKYYVDASNSTTPTLDSTKAKTSGNVYFYCADATAVSIACSGATVTGATLTGGTTTISTAITGGTLSTAIAQKATSTLTWTATYTVGGQTMTAKAYTVCYAPPIEAIGVAQRLYNDDGTGGGDKADLQGWFYVSGVQGYGTGGIKSFNQTPGKVVCPMLGTVTPPPGNTAYSDYITGSSGGVYYGDWSGGDNTYALNKVSPTGILTVDTSRYNNINQIPNFTCGMAITHTNNMDDLWYYMSDYDDVTNYTGDYQGSDSTGVFNNNTGSIFFGDVNTKRTVTQSIIYGGQTGGNVYSNAISGNGTYNMKFKGAASANNNGETNTFACVVPVTVTMVKKDTLRGDIRTHINKGLQKADYPTASASNFDAYEAEIKAAAEILGNPTNSTATNSIASKLTTLGAKACYTATINHKFNNGKTTIAETQTYNSGDTVNFEPNSYTGYTLASADGETASTAAQTLVNRRTAITQNYNYTANTCAVTFSNTGGSTPTVTGKTVTVDTRYDAGSPSWPANPTKTGYTFTNWYNAQTGGNIVTGSTIVPTTIASTQTLYARYTANTYTVTYNGNNNTSGTVPANSSHTYDYASNTLQSNSGTLAMTGYTFGGWSLNADGSGTTYTAPQTGTFNFSATQGATVTLYAKWTAKSYDVTFDANGGTGSMTNQSITFGQSANLTSNAFTRTGYDFAGWATTAGGSVAYNDGVSYTMSTEGATLYAKWTAKSYNITFDANGGTGSMTNQSITFGQSANLTSNAFTRTGYDFAGWATTAGGSVAYNDGVSYTMSTEGATLYAKWTAKSYNVTFNANGGTGSMTNQSITFGQSANLTSNAFTRTGYDFAGWATTAGGSVAYNDGVSYTMSTEGATLYAKWTAKSYNVTFDANGGTGSMTNQSITFGQSANLTSNAFTRTGYDFAGWATTAGGSVAYNDGVSYTMSTEGATLYAQWTVSQSAIDGITVALTENESDMTVTVDNAVAGCKYQIWSYQSITSDLLLDAETSVQANQWVLSKAYDTTGQAVGTLSYTIGKFTSPNNNYTIAVRIVDGSGAYVRELRDSYTKTEVGTAEIAKVLVDGEYVRGSSQEDIDKNIKSTVLKEITPSAASVIKVSGNFSGMTYTATVLETSEVLTAVGNEFTWNISGYIPQQYTVRVTASYGTTTDTLDLRFMLYSSSASVQYGNMSSLSLTNGALPLTVPQIIGINTNFSNGNFHYVVREMGRAANFTSGIYTASGTINHEITRYGTYHVYGYANRTTITPSESNYDDGIIKPIVIKRSNSPSSMTVVATPSFANPIAKGTAITITANASIAGIGATPVEYSFWRYDAKGYVLIKDWSSDNTLAWTPGRVGEYTIQVRAKGDDAGSYEVLKTVEVSITDPNELIAQGVVIELNETELDNAHARTPITVKASATSSNGDKLLYRFFVYDDAMLTRQLQAYSPNQECIWTPRKAGTYKILVQVKNEVSFGKYDATKSFEVTVN